MRTKLCGLALVGLLVAPGAAWAHDHTPPDAVLVTETDSGPRAAYTTTWARRTGELCAVAVGDGTYGHEGPPVQWVPGSDIAVRFEKRQRPSDVVVRGFLVGDPTIGIPIYGEVEVPRELRRVRVGGKTMWEAVLSPPPWPDLYLDVTAEWEDADGCGPQSASWMWRAGLLPI